MAVHTCLLFASVVDIVTSLWVYFARDMSFSTLAKAMYFPGVLSLAFVDDIGAFLRQIIGTQAVFTCVVYSGAAVALTYLLVYGCVGLGVGLGWTAKSQPASIPAQNHISITGFLRAAGEEIGWRCYLLPCLMSHFTPQMALLISGIAWGLFHVAVMILLTKKLKPEHPVRTTVVQCLSCVISAYPHGWLAIKARYSFWPSTLLHFWWNRLNPQVLGSIYTNTPGTYCGPQWKINGEGLSGCVVMLPIALLMSLELNHALY
ncbi:uncharacterized protein LOC110461650 isoform X2 [Mizuhopecten yessoensis]|uniref:CAAX prenyl protease 2/Lysostaphin resistance protein A-like domain-containing protein n=1 Tax=Mizuhopecten yessoensis TaxID=6573 RepID=A0A210PZZ0_MIZYE|nr:uncharacterized protein LOC110461650 isoform X2 [Mizuhopecten yessoensis]OWF42035.1 hypothetical protein KP79_PYT13724 [Mizuhopecten yessoensis]